jgi:hypothetical protein
MGNVPRSTIMVGHGPAFGFVETWLKNMGYSLISAIPLSCTAQYRNGTFPYRACLCKAQKGCIWHCFMPDSRLMLYFAANMCGKWPDEFSARLQAVGLY